MAGIDECACCIEGDCDGPLPTGAIVGISDGPLSTGEEDRLPWAAIIGGGAGGLVLLGVIYAVATDSCKKAEPKAEDKKEKIEADLSANRQQQDAIAP